MILRLLVVGLLFWGPNTLSAQSSILLGAKSPDQRIQLQFAVQEPGRIFYAIQVDGKKALDWSALGFEIKNARPLNEGFAVQNVRRTKVDTTWEQPWGEERWIRNNYNELRIDLIEQPPRLRQLTLVFRVFNDGIGFRYEIPLQSDLNQFIITKEKTEFNFPADHKAWWIDAFDNADLEQHYRKVPLSEMKPAFTPLTIETGDLYLSVHEANLTDYAGMYLTNSGGTKLSTELYPWADGDAVKAQAPMVTPWRTIQIGRTPGDLVTSYLILNLNEPNRIEDTSWIKPQKYLGIWWGMHIGQLTWGSGPDHGATTERAEEYILAARRLKIPGLLIEGWNQGWDGDWFSNGNLFDFLNPYPDFDLQKVAAFARENNVELVGHHETAGGISNYERQMEAAYKLYQSLGIHRVKTGYVANRMENREWRHSQYMVRHHQRVAEMAARYQISLDIHEPIKDTGLRRTYPNIMTREGACGSEYDAWGGEKHNPPNHHTILPFTRSLMGPFDYTPGVFDLLRGKTPQDRIRTTLAKQLALYVTIYSPLHMAADLPENYIGHPMFKFIQDVPTDWETTRVLNSDIGSYATFARKDRNSPDWYLGAVTNEDARTLDVPLSFLDKDKYYLAEIYEDQVSSHYLREPMSYKIRTLKVQRNEVLTLKLAPGGGAAIRFILESE